MSNPLVKKVVLHGTGDEARNHAQKMVVDEFMDQTMIPRYRLMANYATGLGKGKAAIDTAIRFYNEVSKGKLFIATFTESQRDNVWGTELAKWGQLHQILTNNRRECYASMHNIHGEHFGLVILDEAQHLTELSYQFFTNNTFDGILILTATEPKDPTKKLLIRELTAGRRLIIKADQAIDAKILNDFEIIKVMVTLDDTVRTKLFKNSNTLYTDKTGYEKQCLLFDNARRSGDRVRMKFAAINRMRYMGNTLTKFYAAKYIQDQFRRKEQRFITIAASIAQADKLSEHTFHSETNDRHYKDFLHGRIDELVSIKQIREGENFNNLGRGLIVQVDKNANNTIQITGRLMRLPVGEISKVFILCAANTMDESSWVKSALADTNPDKIKTLILDREKYWPDEIPPLNFNL